MQQIVQSIWQSNLIHDQRVKIGVSSSFCWLEHMNPVRIFCVLNSVVTIDNILPSMRPVTNWQYLVMSMWRMDNVLWQFYIPELFCTLWPEPGVEQRPILMERYNFPMWLAEYWLNEFYSILKYLTIKPPLQIWAGQEVRSSGASATFQTGTFPHWEIQQICV